ncbi:hypothetical protein AUC70_05450 [Methyloceanibacter stevinii]|uniref:Uncharacterized protein n=1 Tax=Methyloceanibacter stevinii TaxID=1774970 RepID=A0A1E3VNQ6_9HYPH|nr:hypothetical protein [Methyloceanibacter stevinii]ODR95163.1 hypothetical protein AUC70_05450 [Methyloceanibacter stevinii]
MRGRNGSSLSNLILKIAGAVCMIAGLATVWLPIPTGVILMVIGLTLLIASSPTIAAWARLLRQRNKGLDDKLNTAEPYLPKQMQRVLAKTRPNRTKLDPAAQAAQPAPAPEAPKPPSFTASAGGQAEAS